jgi:predicted ribosomally synthesized peptide with nif11-like leader
MPATHLNLFLSRILNDADLQKRVGKASDLESVEQIARGLGLDVTMQDLLNCQPPRGADELKDDELESVAAGEVCIFSNTSSDQCHVFGSSIFGYC